MDGMIHVEAVFRIRYPHLVWWFPRFCGERRVALPERWPWMLYGSTIHDR